jgi:pimeloyl-ACP methyl ester carboxylesterase
MLEPEQINIDLPNINVAALAWGPKDGMPILALHGWLDNAASFIPIATYLSNFRLIALDLPGHGYSDHRPAGAYFHFYDYAPDVLSIIDHFGWDKCALLGHSLGAGVASLLAGVFPERISALGLIDGLGPLAVSEQQLPDMMRKSIEEYSNLINKQLTVYPDKDAAVKARLSANKMEYSSAELIVHRGLKEHAEGFIWRSDPRLLVKPLIMLCESQIEEFLKRITTKTCLLRPAPGWPFDEKILTNRIALLNDVEVHRIEGEHHIHMDKPELVGKLLQEFFNRVLK